MATRPITFLSDYGADDEFAGVCRAVIAVVAPDARVIDLTHGIRRHDVRDGALALADLSAAARTSLTEASAVTFRAASTSTGTAAGGNATAIARNAVGDYTVTLARDVSACQYGVAVTGAKTPATIEPAPVGFATAAPTTDGTKVSVKTYDPAGAALDAPFSLLVAC
jgi:hypothetical protein